MIDSTIGNQQRSLEQRLCWLGGIIDGEGTITLDAKYSNSSRQNNYHYRPSIKITNTDELIINEIKAIYDELQFPYYESVRAAKENQRAAVTLKIEGIKRVGKVLSVIIPYLVGKHLVATSVAEFIVDRLSSPHKSPMTDDQENLVLIIKQLNHRGVLNRPTTIRRVSVTN